MDNKVKNKKVLKLLGLVGIFLLVFGISYALFTVTLNGTKKVKIKTGKLELQLLDKNDNPIYQIGGGIVESNYEINLDNQVPISDEEGLQSQTFEFKLKNSGNIPTKYTIYLDDVELDDGESRIEDQYIRYSLTKNGSSDYAEDLTNIGANPNRILDKGLINKDITNTYTLKVWIKESAGSDAMNKVFNTTLRVEGSQYVSPFENASFADQLYAKDNVGTLTAPILDGFNRYVSESSGLYKYTDTDNTTTYVYRGNPQDNYVTFAGDTWRILRIQSDGSVKLIREDAVNYVNTTYDSGSSTASGIAYRIVKYNKTDSSDDDNKYSTSNIKNYVEAWYVDILETGYDDKIKANTYCSDRSSPEEISEFAQSQYHSWESLYGIYTRLDKNQDNHYIWMPSVSCADGEEIISKAALITADEYILAGGGTFSGNIYLKTPYWFWTMSPAGFYQYAQALSVADSGYFNYRMVDTNHGVRPVITLIPNISINGGEGTLQRPYIIE